MGDWITDVVGDIKAGVKEADILKKYNLGSDPNILRDIRGYNYLRTSDSEDAARTAYPSIFNISTERNKPKPVPVVPTAQQKDLENQMKGLKEMSKVNRATDISRDDKLKPVAEDIDLMSKKAAVDNMFAKNFAASNMGKTMKGLKDRKAAEEEVNTKVNTALSSARASMDPNYALYQQVVAPILSASQKATGDMASGAIRNLGNFVEAITGDDGISEAVGAKADNVKSWFRRNQSEQAAKRAGGAYLTQPGNQQGSIFNDGKVNTSAIVPRTMETLTTMAYLLGGGQALGGGAAGLMASGYLTTYEDSRDDALNAGLNTEQADAFAGINSTIQAALELISPNDVVFGKVRSKVTGDVLRRIADKTLPKSAIFKEVATAYAKEVGAENLQELTQTAAEKGLKWLYNETQLGEGQPGFQDTKITRDEILETVLLTTLATGAMATPGIMSETRPSKLKVGAYVTASEDLQSFQNLLQKKIEDGSLAEEEAGKIYGEVENFAKHYAENKSTGYSEDQAARMAWNDRAKTKLDQITQQVQGNPTLQTTVSQAVQAGKAELDSDTKDAKLGIPKQGEVVTGDKVAEIMSQIPDKGKPITEGRALEYAGNDYTMGMVKLEDLYKSNKKFAGLVDEYKEAINPTKPKEGETKKPVNVELQDRIKNSDPEAMRMPAVMKGMDVIDGMNRLAQQYVNGTEYARTFQAIGDNAITNKSEDNGKGQKEREEVLSSTEPKIPKVTREVEKSKPPVVENPAQQVFKGKTHNVKYDEKGNRIVVAKNGKPINIESPEAKKALTAHAKNYNYDIGDKAGDKVDQAPEFNGNEDDMSSWMAENSNNPAELVAIYRDSPSKGNALSEKELAIANRGIHVTADSYTRFGDPNKMEKGKRLKYIRKDGLPIDVLAKEISDDTGMEVTPEDIVNFMDTYPGGIGEALKEQESEAQTTARKKFEKITGIPFTPQTADIAFKQYMGPEKVKAAEHKLDEEFDSITDDQIEAAMWEAIDELSGDSSFNPADLEEFYNKTIQNENSEATSENQSEQSPEEDIQFDGREDEVEDPEADVSENPGPDNTQDAIDLANEFDQFIQENTARDIDSELKDAKAKYDQAVFRLNQASAKLAQEQGKQSDIFGTGQQAGMFAASAEDSKAVLDPLRAEVKDAKAELDRLTREKSVQDDSANPDMFEGAMPKMGQQLAPNGKPSNLTPEQYAQVRTPEFKAWFGDWENDPANASKVVDENGEPLVVYHGTINGGFDTFNGKVRGISNAPTGTFFFSNKKDVALSYSGSEKTFTNFDGNNQQGIYHVFLNIKNPEIVDFKGANWDGVFYDKVGVYTSDGGIKFFDSIADAEEFTEQNNISFKEIAKNPKLGFTTNSVASRAKHTGKDGAIMKDVFDQGGEYTDAVIAGDIYVALDSAQIKSATNNEGGFDPSNPSILKKQGTSKLGKLFFSEFKDNNAALDAIADGLSDDPDAQRAVEFIRPILAANPNVKVVPARPGEYSGRLQQAQGLSYPNGEITLNFDAIPDEQSMFRTLLHEYIHAATRYEIENNPAFREELDTVLGDIRDAMGLPDTDALISAMQGMGLIEDGKYGATNAHEMVAEVFSNPEFSNYLRGIEYKGDNLLRRIYLAIVRFFKNAYKSLAEAKEDISAENLADYIMSLTEKIVKPNKTGGDGGVLASMKQKYPADIVRDFIRMKIANGVDSTLIRDMLADKTGMTKDEADAMIVQALAERTYETPGAIQKDFVGNLEEGQRARNLPVRIAPGLDPAIRNRITEDAKKYFQKSNKETQAEADRFIAQHDTNDVYAWLTSPEAQSDLNKLPGETKVFVYAAAIKSLETKVKEAKLKMDFELSAEYADRAARLTGIVAEMGTEFGRAVQAFRVFDKLAPSMIPHIAEKMMDEIERRMRERKGKKKPDPQDPNAPEQTTDPAAQPDEQGIAPAPPTAEEPEIDPDTRKEIMDLADEIPGTPEGLPRAKKIKELTEKIAALDVHNTSGIDIVQAIWYSHILSGLGTHAKNTFANLGNTFAEFFNLGIREVAKTKDLRVLPFMIRSWWDGLGKGVTEATNIMATGLTRETVEKFGQSPLFEWFTWKDYLKEGKVDWAAKKIGLSGEKIGRMLDFPAFIGISPKALRYVGRALSAADAMMYTANAEMASGALAWEQAKIQNSQDPATDIRKMADEMLGNVREKIAKLQDQAEAEGFPKGTRENRVRTNELMLQTRASDLVDVGDQYGAKVTFNHEPNGILAPWYRSVTQLTNNHRSVRFFMPFMRIVTNLMENYLNYTPVGLLKAVQGNRQTDSKYFKKLTPDQRAELYIKFGIGLSAAMATWLLGAFDDDDDGIIEISAAGTGDYQRNYELQKSGWREYSIRMGDFSISYKDSPLFAMLAAIGTASDHYKFGNGDPNDATVLEKMNIAAMGMVNAIFDQSWMSGLDELVTATKGVDKYGRTQSFGGKMADAGIGILRSLAMTNFTTQNIRVVREAMEDPIKRAAGMEKIYRDIPYLNDNLNPIIDVWGQPVVPEQTLSWKPYRMEFDLDEDPVNDFLAKKKIWVGLPERKDVIDYGTGTSMPMTDQQYYEYTKLSGQLSKQYIGSMIADGTFQDMSVVDIKKMIDKERRRAREEAYYQLFTSE